MLSCCVVVADMLSKVLFCCGGACAGSCEAGATGSESDSKSAVVDGVLLVGIVFTAF